VQERIYSLTPGGNEDKYEGEMEYSDVVTGTIPLFGNLASTLFDSGARIPSYHLHMLNCVA
jgi:hypothetical protein